MNPLDLNNFPDDYSDREGKQVLEDTSSSSGTRKKKNGARDGKDDGSRVYECRFCSLKFCKSQALGGHMNRHRQERETETLNRARQLVFNSDHQLSCHPIPSVSYHSGGSAVDSFRSIYQPRFLTGSSSTLISPLGTQPPQPPSIQPFIYAPPGLPSHPMQYSSQPINDYYIGRVVTNPSSSQASPASQYNPCCGYDTSYPCIGAPIGHGGFPPSSSWRIEGTSRDASLEERFNWERGSSNTARSQQHRSDPSLHSRFHDGF